MDAEPFFYFENAKKIHQLLFKYQPSFYPVLGEENINRSICLLDLTDKNEALKQIKFQDTATLDKHIFNFIKGNQAWAGAGGYLEKRVIYAKSAVFGGPEPRSIHLGVDLWAPAFTPLFAPLDGIIFSFKDNEGFGDYGPTIILEHRLEGLKFYTLYGHLSRRSLDGLREGQEIKKGFSFTELGPFPENGDWPPHLHFQIISDMQGMKHDFPGVAAPSQLEKYKAICPDPNLILKLPCLG